MKNEKQILTTVSFIEEGKSKPIFETTLHSSLLHAMLPDKEFKIGDTMITEEGYKLKIISISYKLLGKIYDNIYGLNSGYGIDQEAESNPYNFVIIINVKNLNIG
jgi:hypothetical protein